LHLALGEERIEQGEYVILFTFAELFDILKPFHCPTVKGHVAGLASEIIQCKGMIRFCPEDKRDRVAMQLLDIKDWKLK